MTSEKISSKIWNEIPEKDDPFSASVCLCAGYDVYGEILAKGSWIEYLYLLFFSERPSACQARLLEGLAIALANPGPRDHSVRAAMNGGVSGSPNASSLMAALAIGSGQMSGSQEVVAVMEYWTVCGQDLSLWKQKLKTLPGVMPEGDSIDFEHPPGFSPHANRCSEPTLQILDHFVGIHPAGALAWLQQNRIALEKLVHHPLALSGVAATAFVDLGMDVDQAEMLYLLLRLPGAAVHALEQKQFGWKKYPFFLDELEFKENSDES